MAIPRADKIAELKRELALRRRVYPKWVAEGRLSRGDMERRIAVLEAVLADVQSMGRPS